MKCTESEDEDPTKGSESQLQLSCFINQEVKYLATGLRLVSGTSRTQMSHQCSQSLLILICLFISRGYRRTSRSSPHPYREMPSISNRYVLPFGISDFCGVSGEILLCSMFPLSYMNKMNSHFLCFCIQVQNQPSPSLPHGSNGAVLLQRKRVCECQSPQGRYFTEEGFGISGVVTKISIH